MTKRTINLFAFLFLLATMLHAQEDFGFDISKYQTPDISRKGLNVEIKTKNEFENYLSKTNDTQTSKSRSYDTNNNLNINFWLYENTRKKISSFTIGTQTNLYAKGFRDVGASSKSSSLDNSFYLPIIWENKFFTQPKLFLIYDAEVSPDFKMKKNTSMGELRYLSDYKSFYLDAAIGVGFGRMENVTDARQAIYILDALKENNVLNGNIDATKVDEFAKVISTVKNKRFLDARLHKIDELTTVDKFLKDNNMLTSSDISYFTALNDMWEYGDLFERKSGYELSLKNIIGNQWFKNKVYENQQGYVQDFYIRDNSFTDKIALSFIYSKPIKLNWQQDFTSNLIANFVRGNRYNSQLDLKTENKPPMVLSAGAEYKLGYYPNTRTNIYSSFIAQYFPGLIGAGTQYRVEDGLYFGVNFGAYYYFSPNLRLSADAYIGNATYLLNTFEGEDREQRRNSFRSGFDITLTYSFF